MMNYTRTYHLSRPFSNSPDQTPVNYYNSSLMDFDLDDELEMLQRELMAVQEEKTNPLSERTVAEIMVKLYHEGFSFYPTTDGNEYLTPEQLDKEIANLVRERGKINLTIIPQILNIGIDTIESRVNSVLQKGNITRHVHNLISTRYFDNLVANLRQKLDLQGKVELQQVAIEHELNIKFIEKLVAENIEKLQAELVGNQLITREYTRLKKAKILGFLSAINNPINTDLFLKATGIENRNIEDIINELIAQGKLKGKYQNSYYVPDRFTANQKRIITQFYENNGYIDAEMLQKKFLVSKPEEWIEKNLNSQYIKLEKMYFKPQKLESYSAQINSLLNVEGYVELSHVLPIELQDKHLHSFLEDYCKLKDYFICEGYVYSNEWLQKLANQFKEKIIYNIFFKKAEPKGKDAKKKGGKKEKVELLTEQDLKETMFNGGYAEYSVAENLAPELLPLMLERLEQMKKRVDKELAQNKGFINSTFLKYRSCKTILRTEESLTRQMNILQKQQKKGEKWVDSEFGVNQNDKNGQYCLIYYDNALPKGWPSLETLKWADASIKQLLVPDTEQPPHMKKCLLSSLLQLIQFHNSRKIFKVHNPELYPLTEQSTGPFVYQYFISQKEKRYVIVDDKLPYVEQKLFSSPGRYAFAEKAYAKLRYCYKGAFGVGIQQMMLEITGKQTLKYAVEGEKEREMMLVQLSEHFDKNDFVIVIAEGEGDRRPIFQDKQTAFVNLKPYYLYRDQGVLKIYPNVADQEIHLNMVVEIFKNIIILPADK